MIDTHALMALSAVLRSGSFEGAAAELNITQSAVSQRVKALEERLGTVLIRRTRPASATRAGARLLRHAEEVGLLEKTLAADLKGLLPDPATPLRIAVNADSLASWAMPALAAVPGFLYHLEIDDQDHSADWLKRGEVSAAVTAGESVVPGCDAFPLGSLRYIATCAPDFAATWFADGVTAEALAKAPALTFNSKDRLQQRWAEQITGSKIALPTHFLASSHGFVDAAKLGIGWGLNPEMMVEQPLAEGSLVALAPDQVFDTPLSWQVPRQMAEPLRPLTRAIRKAAAAHLIPAK
ncbi:ArgP/LysG family DNA-binding transcriptional regulator [Roseobacter sp. HKCCD9010]|uniref:LysR family transcriptional regulator ArgP n=1 Tax=unclassified Roseobacter TaxID=196798 RepID=UPI001490BEF5|nr:MULTISPECIES: LysR family transcriptional regulator ArgP [unclassified Roseobacter]MBF9049168.1 ArgP/LysG family DNA-binding transcriptional regulator [Rhodobacterales bacterium HKCCD4356]NNV11168.1 ArgP/LysG family DNA-binding transcriptional regulator [Roseobacter sp. HKCCD7357]NNV15352.1 ArgP/LysG family DNA-binding transcriptional regulator [Roseobacter sp. HKCCD8768]NNV24812.1 ArgP/LysG family DNA-binding transcriptional regulator [Roseobacter sp. HKCCD8192]NNV29068.1 ArgP/LysG family 